MLTKEENELLTRVGPGMPCGELLRRYWQPVDYVRDFTSQQPIKRVKVMHEELVVFRTPDGGYTLDNFPSHDTMAWETQGARYDRSTEHLGASDRGIVLFRKLLREQIAVVQAGGDPLGVIRDPDKNRFIELPAWVAEEEDEVVAAHAGGAPTARSMAAVFDERHEVFQVPPGAARPVDR